MAVNVVVVAAMLVRDSSYRSGCPLSTGSALCALGVAYVAEVRASYPRVSVDGFLRQWHLNGQEHSMPWRRVVGQGRRGGEESGCGCPMARLHPTPKHLCFLDTTFLEKHSDGDSIDR